MVDGLIHSRKRAGYRQRFSFLARCSATATFAAWTFIARGNPSFFRNPTLRLFFFVFFCKEEFFHLLTQNLARFWISHIQSVVIDDERTLGRPHIIGLL